MGKISNSIKRIETDALPERNNKSKKDNDILETLSRIEVQEKPIHIDEVSLLSISAAARLLKVRKSRVYDLINKGEIKIIQFDGSVRIPYFELKRCIESLCRIAPKNNAAQNTPELKSKVSITPQDIMDNIRRSRAKDE